MILAPVSLAAGCAQLHATASSRSPLTDLTVEVRTEPGASPRRFTLRCDPPRGTVPAPAAACARIAALVAAPEVPPLLAPPGAEEVCTQIYGGPARAVVRGVLGGSPVDATLTRRDGCEIDRYDRMLELLGIPEGRPGAVDRLGPDRRRGVS